MRRDSHDFDINRVGSAADHGVNRRTDLTPGHLVAVVRVRPDFAREVPNTEIRRKSFAAFALNVFADVVLHGFDDTCIHFAGKMERKGLFHNGERIMGSRKR
jgi:hypothetical protein